MKRAGCLINFVLIIDNKRLMAVADNPDDLEKIKSRYGLNESLENYVIEPFSINPIQVCHGNNRALKWEKIPGYSLWQILPGK